MLRKAFDFGLAVLITCFYWAFSRLWAYRHIGQYAFGVKGQPTIYAHWHGDELLLVGSRIRSGMAIMTSRSRDGLLMKRILCWLGYYVVRGSSSRGGAAGLKGLIDAVVQRQRSASLAVDGPRGPIYKVKPGVLKLAQRTGRPIVPGAAAASWRWVFEKAWNRCYLPLPFARCIIYYGDPIWVPADASAEELERIRLQLETSLLGLKEKAESAFERSALQAPISSGV